MHLGKARHSSNDVDLAHLLPMLSIPLLVLSRLDTATQPREEV